MTRKTLALEAAIDRKFIGERGGSTRYLVVTLTAPDSDREKAAARVAKNLALIIDASGSMSGGKLEAAKAGAAGVVERLEPEDRLSLVSFATDVITHLSAVRVDDEGKPGALGIIDSLEPRDMTNLAGGWQAGAKAVGLAMSEGEPTRNHLVLLTDGMANRGVVEPSVLAQRATELLGRGITSSAVGIGEDYSSDQIEAIGTAGGGGFDHASVPSEIIEIVLGRLATIGEITAEAVRVRVKLPEGAVATCLSRFPTESEGNLIDVAVGGIPGGGTRQVVFRVMLPAGKAGQELPFHVTATWRKPGDIETLAAQIRELVVRFARQAKVDAQPRNAEASLSAAKAWYADVLHRTLELNREHRFNDAVMYIREQLFHFERFCAGIEGTEELVIEMRRLMAHAHRRWGELTRKELSAMSSKASRTELDFRQYARMRTASMILDEETRTLGRGRAGESGRPSHAPGS